MWIADAIDENLIQPSRAANHSGGPDVAIEWLRANLHNIPKTIRPAQDQVEEFGAFFSTYLVSSFDVVEKPGTRGKGPTPMFCRCEVCMRIVNAPHLQTKKLYARDKRRANFLMAEFVMELANQHQMRVNDELVVKIVNDKATRRSSAYMTYAQWLIRRLTGESDGPAILALWRIIAWDQRGGIRTGFTLELDDFKASEATLVLALKSAKQ